MRVLLVSHAYIAPENRHKPTLLGRYQDLEVGVLFPTQWKAMGRTLRFLRQPEDTEANWTFTVPVFASGDASKYLYDPMRLKSVLDRFRPDLIHVEEEPWSLVSGELAIFSKLVRSKFIFFSWENLDLSLSPWQQWVRRLVFSRAELALAGNDEANELLKKTGFKKKVITLTQFGADTDKFSPPPLPFREKLRQQFKLNGFVVGFVGRFVASKGVGVLLRAASELKKDFPEIKFLLVSTTLFPQEFKDLAEELEVGESLIIADGVDHRRVQEYMRTMDVLVLPSVTTATWKEQFGRVLAEAMACRVPVIGSSSGAIPEVIGDAGQIFEEGNATDLAGKIKLLFKEDNLRQSLAAAGYARVTKEYSFKVVAERTYKIYKELLAASYG